MEQIFYKAILQTPNICVPGEDWLFYITLTFYSGIIFHLVEGKVGVFDF